MPKMPRDANHNRPQPHTHRHIHRQTTAASQTHAVIGTWSPAHSSPPPRGTATQPEAQQTDSTTQTQTTTTHADTPTQARTRTRTPDNTPLRERSDTANRGPLPPRNRQVIHATPRCRRHLLPCRRRRPCRTKDGRGRRRLLIDRGERGIPRAVSHPRRTCTRAPGSCNQSPLRGQPLHDDRYASE